MEQNPFCAESRDCSHIVTHKQHHSSFFGNSTHLAQTLLLESNISHSQHFIHQQDFRLQGGGYGESKSQVHPAGIVLHWCIYEFINFCEDYNFVELAFCLSLLHPQNGPVEEYVLPARQLSMEA